MFYTFCHSSKAAEKKKKKPKRKIVLHSQLIALNFAWLEKKKNWIHCDFFFSKTEKESKQKENWQQILQVLIYDYNIENSILDWVGSGASTRPLSQSLAGITANATQL